MNEITVYAEVEVHSTEDPEKVKKAVENILGKAEFEEKPLKRGFVLMAKAKGIEGLSKLYNLLRRERIRDAARTVFFEGTSGNTITFYLNKQVAYVGHISFSQPVAESPLGPIKIQITCDNPRELIDWLAPSTA
ncbi:MAG: RNA-binding domain-containing protein [Candidatus Bathyarchaeia archaeon]